jgi:hypothetical protein
MYVRMYVYTQGSSIEMYKTDVSKRFMESKGTPEEVSYEEEEACHMRRRRHVNTIMESKGTPEEGSYEEEACHMRRRRHVI